MKIVLTKEQINQANKAGNDRQSYNEKIGKKDAYGFRGNGRKIHIQGATAELAVSIALNEDWIDFSEDYELLEADVGKNIQVRSTDYKYGNLLIHPKDKDEQVFILVKSHNFPEMEIVGWIKGADAKKDEYWEDGSNWPAFRNRPCYRVPYQKLNPIKNIIRTNK